MAWGGNHGARGVGKRRVYRGRSRRLGVQSSECPDRDGHSRWLEIRFGALVQIVARDALGIDAYALGDQAMQALDCTALIDVITGGGTSYDLTVGGQDSSVPVAMLGPACADLRADLAADALGLVRPDAGLRLGGPVRLVDANLDGVAEAVTAELGYGGAITSLPGPVEPQVTASFSAVR